MAVANDSILDRAIDCGKRAFKCQCAGRKSRPGRYGRQAKTAATPTATSKTGSVYITSMSSTVTQCHVKATKAAPS